jgi:nucleoside 2-deoxyribosyltransferase
MTGSRSSVADRPVTVFLSHDSADAEAARKIRNLISHHLHARVWMDEDLRVGESWKSKLRKAIRDADLVIALITHNSYNDSWVLQEVGMAFGLEKPILPIVNPRDMLNRFSLALAPDTALDYRVLESPKAGTELAAAFERALSTHYTA